MQSRICIRTEEPRALRLLGFRIWVDFRLGNSNLSRWVGGCHSQDSQIVELSDASTFEKAQVIFSWQKIIYLLVKQEPDAHTRYETDNVKHNRAYQMPIHDKLSKRNRRKTWNKKQWMVDLSSVHVIEKELWWSILIENRTLVAFVEKERWRWRRNEIGPTPPHPRVSSPTTDIPPDLFRHCTGNVSPPWLRKLRRGRNALATGKCAGEWGDLLRVPIFSIRLRVECMHRNLSRYQARQYCLPMGWAKYQR
jgi:hypothetical protein